MIENNKMTVPIIIGTVILLFSIILYNLLYTCAVLLQNHHHLCLF